MLSSFEIGATQTKSLRFFRATIKTQLSLNLVSRSDSLCLLQKDSLFILNIEIYLGRWKLTDGTTAFNQWFKNNQVSATPSDAGRATQQIIQTLGGFDDVGCLAHEGVIRLLNKISRRPVTKTNVYGTFRGQINCAVNSEILGNSIFETLVQRKAVELGLELKCGKCDSWSWYSVKQLDYTLTCDLCFKQTDFPVLDPINRKHSRWAYA